MAEREEFQNKIRRLGELVNDLEALPDNDERLAARELVQLLLDVHGTAIERLMEIVFESGPGGDAVIARAADDPAVSQILLLHSLHPDGLEERIMKALDAAARKLRRHDGEADLISIHDGGVKIRLRTAGHNCGSTTDRLKSIVEACIYDLAPDVASLEIVGVENEVPPGFVSIESLLKHTQQESAGQRVVLSAD